MTTVNILGTEYKVIREPFADKDIDGYCDYTSREIRIRGLVGEVDGVLIIKAPASYFPKNTNFVITNPVVMPAPIKLTEYKIHDDAPGISGSLVEGRIRYDAFVLDQKKDAIGVCQNPAG